MTTNGCQLRRRGWTPHAFLVGLLELLQQVQDIYPGGLVHRAQPRRHAATAPPALQCAQEFPLSKQFQTLLCMRSANHRLPDLKLSTTWITQVRISSCDARTSSDQLARIGTIQGCKRARGSTLKYHGPAKARGQPQEIAASFIYRQTGCNCYSVFTAMPASGALDERMRPAHHWLSLRETSQPTLPCSQNSIIFKIIT